MSQPPHLPREIAVFRARKHLRTAHPDAYYPVIEEALAQVIKEDADLAHQFYHEPERCIDVALEILRRDVGGDRNSLWIVNGERVSTLPI